MGDEAGLMSLLFYGFPAAGLHAPPCADELGSIDSSSTPSRIGGINKAGEGLAAFNCTG
jgi:hypothetical protein